MASVVELLPLWLLIVVVVDVTSSSQSHHGRLTRAAVKDSKIVGGHETTIDHVPYLVFVVIPKNGQNFQCGGAIISPQYILTAAHCLEGINKVYVRAGATKYNSDGKLYESEYIITNRDFNVTNLQYDAALIKLTESVRKDDNRTSIVRLPKLGARINLSAGTRLVAAGWGRTAEDQPNASKVRAVHVPVRPDAECQHGYDKYVPDKMFCAGNTGEGVCWGDSGGPAVTENNRLLVGIISYSVGCARPGFPAIYTKISAVRGWIRTITGL